MCKIGPMFRRTTPITLLIVLALAAAAPALEAACERNRAIPFTGTWRGTLGLGTDYLLRLPNIAAASPEIVVLEITKPVIDPGDGSAPLLIVCLPERATKDVDVHADIEILQRSPTRQALLVRKPGDITFRVTSQDLLHPAGPVKVTAAVVREFSQLASGDAAARREKDVEEMEIEPDGTAMSCPRSDDHSDASSCATPMTVPATSRGRVGNAWGDDVDVFTFEITDPSIVTIETHGATDTVGGLLSDSGVLLAAADDNGMGANFRLARALAPGRYYIRVEGRAGAEGEYGLTLESVSW